MTVSPSTQNFPLDEIEPNPSILGFSETSGSAIHPREMPESTEDTILTKIFRATPLALLRSGMGVSLILVLSARTNSASWYEAIIDGTLSFAWLAMTAGIFLFAGTSIQRYFQWRVLERQLWTKSMKSSLVLIGISVAVISIYYIARPSRDAEHFEFCKMVDSKGTVNWRAVAQKVSTGELGYFESPFRPATTRWLRNQVDRHKSGRAVDEWERSCN